MKRVIRSDCLPQRQKVPLCLPLRRPVNPSVHYVHPSWTAFAPPRFPTCAGNAGLMPTLLLQMNFYENSIRKIGKILKNNWGEILEFWSRIIGGEKRIMCRPLPEWRGLRVLWRCDNQAAVHAVLARSCRDKSLMHLLRCLFFLRPTTSSSWWPSISQGSKMF